MNIKLNTRPLVAEIVIESGNTKIVEDLATASRGSSCCIPDSEIENFLTIANEMSRYNNYSDVQFAKLVVDSFLNDSERKQLIELLSN